jgi:hypothetical protein
LAGTPADRLSCVGTTDGCQNGGSFGYGGIVKLNGKLYCWDCAVKKLGLQGLPYKEQVYTIGKFDPMHRA